jgi:hypothetical protein
LPRPRRQSLTVRRGIARLALDLAVVETARDERRNPITFSHRTHVCSVLAAPDRYPGRDSNPH